MQESISHLCSHLCCWFLRGLPSAAKHPRVDGWVILRSSFLCLSPPLFRLLLLLLLSLFAHVYVLSLINTSSFCVFDCLGHAGNFCFLLSASPGAMCAQRQNGFQRRLHPPLWTRCRHPIEGHSAVPDAGSLSSLEINLF